jgi:hypothetical protein
MADTSIEIKGMDVLFRKLGTMEKVQDHLEPRMKHWTDTVLNEWHNYPPPLPNQRYVRTLKLSRGRRTIIQRVANGLVGIARNEGVPYSPWVIKAKTQAGIHRNRWNTDEGMVQKYTPLIQADFDKAVQDAINKA